VPSSTNFTAFIGATNFKQKELAFTTGVTCGRSDFCAEWRRCGVIYIDSDAD
jgi:hypothetical protein